MSENEQRTAAHGALSPYICVNGGAAAIDFYTRAFGATETFRIADPSGRVGHAELNIGGATLMLSDEYPEMGIVGPTTLGGSPVTLHIYVPDVDAVVARAIEAGGTLVSPVEDQFYGDRGGKLKDPFGHIWWVATRKESMSVDEMKRRARELYGSA